jgi:uncharacterized membrane protein YbhN (UPF0104 family)
MKKKLKTWFFFLLRVFISLVILFFLFKKTDINKIKTLFLKISFHYYFLGLLSFFLLQVSAALRWKIICKSWGFSKSWLFFYKNYLMGFSLNTVVPGLIGGDFLRAFLLTKSGLNWKKASFSVVLDRGYGFLGILTILAISLPLAKSFLPSAFFTFLKLLTLSVILLFFILSTLLTLKIKKEIFKPLFFPYSFLLFFLGIVVQFFFVMEFVYLAKALSISLDIKTFFAIIPIVSFVSTLPVTISGLGIREGSLSYFFSLLGKPIEYGVSLGLLAYTVILLLAIPGVLLYLKVKIRTEEIPESIEVKENV